MNIWEAGEEITFIVISRLDVFTVISQMWKEYKKEWVFC